MNAVALTCNGNEWWQVRSHMMVTDYFEISWLSHYGPVEMVTIIFCCLIFAFWPWCVFIPIYTGIASDGLKGRVFEVSLADLQNDEVAFRKFKLITEDVQGKNCLTNFHGMDLTRDKMCSMVKKWQVINYEPCWIFLIVKLTWLAHIQKGIAL